MRCLLKCYFVYLLWFALKILHDLTSPDCLQPLHVCSSCNVERIPSVLFCNYKVYTWKTVEFYMIYPALIAWSLFKLKWISNWSLLLIWIECSENKKTFLCKNLQVETLRLTKIREGHRGPVFLFYLIHLKFNLFSSLEVDLVEGVQGLEILKDLFQSKPSVTHITLVQ